jgi:glycosyltransferase involved in cell wall biosynthesis
MARVADRAVLYLGGTFADPGWGRETEARIAGELAGAVRLLGRVPPADVPGVLAAAEVVWVPAQQTSQYALPTVATKLYEGLAVGLAALVSDLPGRSELVREERCGITVPPTVEGHLRGVRQLTTDRDAVAPMGDRGRRAVRERYSWEVVEGRLVDFYAELTRGVASR